VALVPALGLIRKPLLKGKQMKPDTQPLHTHTCSNCGENIARNMNGGWFNPYRANAGAGHRSVECGNSMIEVHRIEKD
jgi:hypothetical protein